MRILIVDDDPEMLVYLETVLESRGHDVFSATSVDDALGVLDAADAVITDLVMPGRDGLALGWEIRRRHPDLPIVFATGCSPDSDLARRAARLGPLLQKPWTLVQIDAVVADLSRRAAAVVARRRE